MAGTFSLKTFALMGETCLAMWAAYVFYRWHFNLTSEGMTYWAFDPFMGPFETVVAPWLFALIPIPACLFALNHFRLNVRTR
jgi:hypothetical protein